MSDKYEVSNKLPGKQVSILAHRRRRILQDKSVLEQKRQDRIKAFNVRKKRFRRAEYFIMKYIKAERTQKRTKQLLLRGSFLKTEKTSEKLLVVMRSAGRVIADETTNKILSTLRLTKTEKVVILKNTHEHQLLLKVVEPFVTFGYPTNTTIRDLVFKFGFAHINGKKTPINSNQLIEEELGNYGIICIEDIIHEIFTVGPNFDRVIQFLYPFQLKRPRDGWKKKVSVPYIRGGEYGNRKHAINDLIARCL